MTRFFPFVGVLLLMLACALTAHAQTTTITVSADTVRQGMTYLIGTYDVTVDVYSVDSNTLLWSSDPVPNVFFTAPYGQFSFNVDVPNMYFTPPPGDYIIVIVITRPPPASPIVITLCIRLGSGITSYYCPVLVW